jgi:predicted amidophosphoribosyltransferase
MEIKPQKIEGNWEEGWAMDLHTTSSTPITDEAGNIVKWNNIHPPIAEELYQLKYCKDKSKVDNIAKTVSDFINEKKKQWNIDLIISVPPSDIERAYQPVTELINAISELSDLSVDYAVLKKNEATPPLKTIDDPEARREILKNAFSVEADALKGKNILIFDDIYRSGETLNAVSDVIQQQGNAEKVYVLTVTKTRVKK